MANSNTVEVQITANAKGLKNGLVQAENGVKKFGNETNKLTKITAKNTKGLVKGAVPAMTSFSQVVQDAPFGIRGVANNIQQLTMQMGHLSANAGGTKKALAAMVSTLTGPAGILLAVSLVTSLMVSYGKEIKQFIRGTDDARFSTEKLNDALRAQVGLRKLLKDELSIATSIAVAEAKLAGKSAEEQFKVRQKFSKANIAILDTQYKESVKNVKAFYERTKRDQAKGDEEVLELQKNYSKEAAKILKTLNDAKAQLYLDDLNEQIRVQEKSKNVTSTFQGEVISNLQTFRNELVPIVASIGEVMTNLIPESAKVQFTDFEIALIDFNNKASSIIKSGITDTFAGLGAAIGEGLANGGNVLESLGGALLSGIGQIAIKLGEAAIGIGIGMIAIKSAFANPFTAIAAGVALVAIGTAISSKASGIVSGNDNGTSADYSSQSSGGSYSGSTTGFSSSDSGGGRYVFEIAGTKLIGVLQNTLDRNKAFGGKLVIG